MGLLPQEPPKNQSVTYQSGLILLLQQLLYLLLRVPELVLCILLLLLVCSFKMG